MKESAAEQNTIAASTTPNISSGGLPKYLKKKLSSLQQRRNARNSSSVSPSPSANRRRVMTSLELSDEDHNDNNSNNNNDEGNESECVARRQSSNNNIENEDDNKNENKESPEPPQSSNQNAVESPCNANIQSTSANLAKDTTMDQDSNESECSNGANTTKHSSVDDHSPTSLSIVHSTDHIDNESDENPAVLLALQNLPHEAPTTLPTTPAHEVDDDLSFLQHRHQHNDLIVQSLMDNNHAQLTIQRLLWQRNQHLEGQVLALQQELAQVRASGSDVTSNNITTNITTLAQEKETMRCQMATLQQQYQDLKEQYSRIKVRLVKSHQGAEQWRQKAMELAAKNRRSQLQEEFHNMEDETKRAGRTYDNSNSTTTALVQVDDRDRPRRITMTPPMANTRRTWKEDTGRMSHDNHHHNNNDKENVMPPSSSPSDGTTNAHSRTPENVIIHPHDLMKLATNDDSRRHEHAPKAGCNTPPPVTYRERDTDMMDAESDEETQWSSLNSNNINNNRNDNDKNKDKNNIITNTGPDRRSNVEPKRHGTVELGIEALPRTAGSQHVSSPRTMQMRGKENQTPEPVADEMAISGKSTATSTTETILPISELTSTTFDESVTGTEAPLMSRVTKRLWHETHDAAEKRQPEQGAERRNGTFDHEDNNESDATVGPDDERLWMSKQDNLSGLNQFQRETKRANRGQEDHDVPNMVSGQVNDSSEGELGNEDKNRRMVESSKVASRCDQENECERSDKVDNHSTVTNTLPVQSVDGIPKRQPLQKAGKKKQKSNASSKSGWISNKPARDLLKSIDSATRWIPAPSMTGGNASKTRSTGASNAVNKPSLAKPDAVPSNQPDLFDDLDDNYESKPSYRYRETVRCKAARQKLPCHDCEECSKFYNAICQGPGAALFSRPQLMDASRHRARFSPENTPEHFWELSFRDEVVARERLQQQLQAEAEAQLRTEAQQQNDLSNRITKRTTP